MARKSIYFILLILSPLVSALPRDYYPPLQWNVPLDLSYTRGLILSSGAKGYKEITALKEGVDLPALGVYPIIGNSGWQQGTPPRLYYRIDTETGPLWISGTQLAPLLYSDGAFHLACQEEYTLIARDSSLGELWVALHKLIIAGGTRTVSFPLDKGDIKGFQTFTPLLGKVENVNGDKKKEIILEGDWFGGRWKTEGVPGRHRLYLTLENNTPRVLFEHWLSLGTDEGESLSRINFKDPAGDGFKEVIEVQTITPGTRLTIKSPEEYPQESLIEVSRYIFSEGKYLPEGESRQYRPVVGTNNLRVRSQPDLEGEIIGKVNKWETPYILGFSEEEETIEGLTSLWYKILWYESTSGWIFGGYINFFLPEDVRFRAPANFE